MTLEEAVATVGRITLGFPFKAWGMEVEAFAHAGGLSVSAMVRSPHRDTGQPPWGPAGVRLARSMDAHEVSLIDAQTLVDWVRRALLQALVLHELDESLLVDGRRVYDPHRDEP